MPGALEGLRVIDATQMLAGPMAATRLGDLGADVIKLESPRGGEFNRTHGFADVRVGDEMTTFLAVNRNKRSLALDVKAPTGRAALLKVVETADVFIQNFRHGTADRLGIGYEDLAAVNPGLVYCSISGYGAVGPYRDRPGQDLVLQGYSGSMWSVGKADDPPTPGALWAADVMTGYQAAIGILAALQARATSSRGQHVEINMLGVVLDAQLQELVTFLNAGTKAQRSKEWSAHAIIPAPYGVYQTKDGWLTLAMAPLPALGEVLDDPYLRTLTEYNDGHEFRDVIYQRIRLAFQTRTTEEWLVLCDLHGVWAGPVYDYDDLVTDPHIAAGKFLVDQPQRQGSIKTAAVPISLSGTPTSIRRGAPSLGEHSVEILRETGMPSPDIERLRSTGVLKDDAPAPPASPGVPQQDNHKSEVEAV